jgi:hypothetical protein
MRVPNGKTPNKKQGEAFSALQLTARVGDVPSKRLMAELRVITASDAFHHHGPQAPSA